MPVHICSLHLKLLTSISDIANNYLRPYLIMLDMICDDNHDSLTVSLKDYITHASWKKHRYNTYAPYLSDTRDTTKLQVVQEMRLSVLTGSVTDCT